MLRGCSEQLADSTERQLDIGLLYRSTPIRQIQPDIITRHATGCAVLPLDCAPAT